jgi:hypothetical protein
MILHDGVIAMSRPATGDRIVRRPDACLASSSIAPRIALAVDDGDRHAEAEQQDDTGQDLCPVKLGCAPANT